METVTTGSDVADGNNTPKASRRSPTIRFADSSKPVLPTPTTISPIGSTFSSGRIHSEVRRSFLEKPGDEPPVSTILDTFPDKLLPNDSSVAPSLAIDTAHVPRYVTTGVALPPSPNGKRSEATNQEVRIHQNHVVNPVHVEVNPLVVNPEQATLYSNDTDEEDDNVPLASNRPAHSAQQGQAKPISPLVTPDEPLVNLVNRLKISGSSNQVSRGQSTSPGNETPLSAGPLKGGLLSPSNYNKEIDSKRKQFSLPLGPPSPMSPETPDIDDLPLASMTTANRGLMADLPLASMTSANRGLMADQEHMRLMMMGMSMGMGLGLSMSGTVPPGYPGYPMAYPGMPGYPTSFGYPQAPPHGAYLYPGRSSDLEARGSAGKSSKKKPKKEARQRSTSKSSRSSSKSRSRSRIRNGDDDQDDDDDRPIKELNLSRRGRSATRKKPVSSDDVAPDAASNDVPASTIPSRDEIPLKSQVQDPTIRTSPGDQQGMGQLSLSPVLSSSSSSRVRDDWQPNSPTREQLVKSRVVRDRLSPSMQSENPFDSKKHV